jgi:hypothetical protein
MTPSQMLEMENKKMEEKLKGLQDVMKQEKSKRPDIKANQASSRPNQNLLVNADKTALQNP